MIASFMCGEMSRDGMMIRPWLASVARYVPWTSVSSEFCAFLNSSRFSSSGRSEATAIIIPKAVETSARIDRPKQDQRKAQPLEPRATERWVREDQDVRAFGVAHAARVERPLPVRSAHPGTVG